MDQHIIDYIQEELDRNLDNQVNNNDNSNTNYNVGHCKNNGDTIGVVTMGSKERYRYAPARNSNVVKSSARQQRSAGIWNQV